MRRFTGNPVCGTKSHLYSQFVLKSSRSRLRGRTRAPLSAPLCVGIDRTEASQLRDEGYKMCRRSVAGIKMSCGAVDPIPRSDHPNRTLNATAMEVGRAGYAGHRRLGVRVDAPQLRACLSRVSQQPDCGPGTTRVRVIHSRPSRPDDDLKQSRPPMERDSSEETRAR